MSNSWDRRDGESSTAYKCFSTFLHAGADRSVVSAYRRETGKKKARSVSGTWNGWVLKFEWQSRAVEYDNQLAQIELDERRKAIKGEETKWALRRLKLREEEFLVSEELLATGRAILKANRFSATATDATRMLALATIIKRRATEMEKHADDEQQEQVGAKVIRFPVAVASADEWSKQYKKA